MHPPSLLHQNPTCIISNLPSVVHDILLGGVAIVAWMQQLQMNQRLWWPTLILVQSTPGPFLFTFCSVSQFQIPFHLLFSVVTQSQTPSNFLFSCDTISHFSLSFQLFHNFNPPLLRLAMPATNCLAASYEPQNRYFWGHYAQIWPDGCSLPRPR